MENMDSQGGSISAKSFFKHVFNFEEDGKGEIINVIQFSLLSILPIVILNKVMQKFVPEADDQKGSMEILAEVVIQVIVMFVGLLFIDRMVTFVPTYSGIHYPEHSILFFIIGILMVTLSLQTKLGEKVSILVDRAVELWEGKSETDKKNKKKKGQGQQGQGQIKVSQPIAQAPPQIMRETFSDGTPIDQLSQGQPDFNNMYSGKQTPLVDAATPGQNNPYVDPMMMSGPMAANEALGGSFGGSSW